jgi:hypothetical protein
MRFEAGSYSPEEARKIVVMLKTPVIFTRQNGASCPLCEAIKCRITSVRGAERWHKCWRCGTAFRSIEK